MLGNRSYRCINIMITIKIKAKDEDEKYLTTMKINEKN